MIALQNSEELAKALSSSTLIITTLWPSERNVIIRYNAISMGADLFLVGKLNGYEVEAQNAANER